MNQNDLFAFCNGIMADTLAGWEVQFEGRVDATDVLPANGKSITYEMSGVGRYWNRKDYAAKVAARLIQWDACARYGDIHVAAHSEGCDLLCLALTNPLVRLGDLHLIGAANDARFDKNGLNSALADGRVKRVFVHWSADDEVLWMASAFWLWGNALGKAGPEKVDPEVASRVFSLSQKRKHCEWVYEKGDQTFRDIMRWTYPSIILP